MHEVKTFRRGLCIFERGVPKDFRIRGSIYIGGLHPRKIKNLFKYACRNLA